MARAGLEAAWKKISNLSFNPFAMDPRFFVEDPSLEKDQALRNLFTFIYMLSAAFFAAVGISYSTKSSASCNPMPEYGEDLGWLRNLALTSLALSWLTAAAMRLKVDFSSLMAVAVKLKLLGARRRLWLLKKQFGPVFLVLCTVMSTAAGALSLVLSFAVLAQINAAELFCGGGSSRRLTDTDAAHVLIGFRLAASVLIAGLLLWVTMFSIPSVVTNLRRAMADKDRDFEDDDGDAGLCRAV